MRCFIAIDLPEYIRKEISEIQEKLPEAKLKLVKPENMHLTLKFLGDVDEKHIIKIKDILKDISINLNCRINNIGVFTNSFIRAIWAGVEPEEKLREIYDLIQDKLEKLGFKKDKKWKSHATLARASGIKDRKRFLEALEKIKVKPLEFKVNEVKLKSSALTPEGPVYEDL